MSRDAMCDLPLDALPHAEDAPAPGGICHVITNFEARGGAERMLARLVNADSDGPRPAIISLLTDSESTREMIKRADATIRPLHVRSLPGMLVAAFRLAAIIRRDRPELVVCWMYHAMFVGLVAVWLSRTGVPVYWNVRQAMDDPKVLSRSVRIAIRLCALVSPYSAGIIYNSRRAARQHGAAGFAPPRQEVIPNGFEMPANRVELPERARLFGIVGRLHPQKDHATFFQAARLVLQQRPDARFAAIGRGCSSDTKDAIRLVEDAELPRKAVALVGEVTDLAALYTSIDVLVLSSRTEGFPNVVAEAMSYGRPVIATDVGDAAEIVGATGLVVSPGRPDLLAEAMLNMMSVPAEEFRNLAEAARDRIAGKYAIGEVLERYSDFLSPGPSLT